MTQIVFQCSPKPFFVCKCWVSKFFFGEACCIAVATFFGSMYSFFFQVLYSTFLLGQQFRLTARWPNCGLPTAFLNAKFSIILVPWPRRLSNSRNLSKTPSKRAHASLNFVNLYCRELSTDFKSYKSAIKQSILRFSAGVKFHTVNSGISRFPKSWCIIWYLWIIKKVELHRVSLFCTGFKLIKQRNLAAEIWKLSLCFMI